MRMREDETKREAVNIRTFDDKSADRRVWRQSSLVALFANGLRPESWRDLASSFEIDLSCLIDSMHAAMVAADPSSFACNKQMITALR